MPRIKLRDFSKHLYLSPPEDAIPDNALRRARGVHALKTLSIRSRWGSVKVNDYPAKCLFFFNSTLCTFTGSQLVVGANTLTLTSSNPLSFLAFPPNADKTDYLFISNGGALYKMSPAGEFTKWGIDPPASDFTSAVVAAPTLTFGWLAAGTLSVDESDSAEISSTTAADLSVFSSGAVSSDADYIVLDVKISNSYNLSKLQIIFSLGDTAFTTNTLTRTIDYNPSSAIETNSYSGQIGIAGLGSTELYNGQDQEQETQRSFTAYDEDVPLVVRNTSNTISLRNSLQKDNINYANTGTWETLRLVKSSFSRFGSADLDWSDVQGVKLIATANDGGAVVVDYSTITMVGGVGTQGDYRHYVTFYNSETGSESNPNENPVLTSNVFRQAITLSAIPQSSDAQVSHINIYRTVGDGSVPFFCARIADGVTSYTDTVGDCYVLAPEPNAVLLGASVLNFQNIVPEPTFGRVASFQSAVFWTQNARAVSGNLYYSRTGHAEASEGFLRITSSSDPLQTICLFNGFLYAFSRKHLYRITGTNPYYSAEVFGVPGTSQPDTVTITPYGIIYQASDGIRLFNGSTSTRIGWEALSCLLSGEDAENLNAFTGTCAAFYREEYYISDGTQTLVHNLKDQTWRDLGLGFDCFFAEEGTLYAGNSSGVYLIEVPNALTDDGDPIEFEIQTKQIMLDVDRELMINHLFVDIDTSSQPLTITLITDKGEISLGTFNTSTRQTITYPIGRNYNRIGVRLKGSISAQVEVFGIEFDIDN